MSICFRCVDNKLDICEMFLDFVELERITGKHIGNRLLNFYGEAELNIKECGGQCYDGAADMQSQKKGAASFILKESPNAVATHCCSHNLNLSLASSCKIPIFVNIKKIQIFFLKNGPCHRKTGQKNNKQKQNKNTKTKIKCVGGGGGGGTNLLYLLCLISNLMPQLEQSSLQPSTYLHHCHLLQTTSYNHLLLLHLLISRKGKHNQQQARNPP